MAIPRSVPLPPKTEIIKALTDSGGEPTEENVLIVYERLVKHGRGWIEYELSTTDWEVFCRTGEVTERE